MTLMDYLVVVFCALSLALGIVFAGWEQAHHVLVLAGAYWATVGALSFIYALGRLWWEFCD